MKLQNKKTLKVVDVEIKPAFYENIVNIKLKDKKTGAVIALYKTLAELNEEWQDYEEPKGVQNVYVVKDWVYIKMSSEEEAEKAVEKLEAWTRLKDGGFKFTGYDLYSGSGVKDKTEGEFAISAECSDFVGNKDLDLLFGGEDA